MVRMLAIANLDVAAQPLCVVVQSFNKYVESQVVDAYTDFPAAIFHEERAHLHA